MRSLLEDAELRGTGRGDQDTLHAAEGTPEELDAPLRYVLARLRTAPGWWLSSPDGPQRSSLISQ